MSRLREKIVLMAHNDTDAEERVSGYLAAARMALEEYAQMMDRAKQPAAALGASLLAEKLK